MIRFPSWLANIEALVVQLNVVPSILVCCIYIPPTCSEQHFNDFLNFTHMLPADRDLLLVSNFNAPDINWNKKTASTIHSSSPCNSLHSKNLIQLIISKTHKLGNTLRSHSIELS